MFGALVAVAVLATVGLLFAMDPGGVIAESGFPDHRGMDWQQLATWGFRTIGMVAAQLLIIVLWLWPKYRPPEATPWSSGTVPAGSMPAAAVSALQGHAIWSPTMLASIIEMCQRGTLRIEAVGTPVGYLYRLSRQGPTEYDWERTICNALPRGRTSIDALDERITRHRDTIGDQIGDYLQQRGLFHDNPVRVRREDDEDAAGWGLLAGILMGVGTGLWTALWLDQWWASALIGAFAGLVYLGVAPTVPSGMLTPTPAGAREIGQWFGLEKALAGQARSEPVGTRDQSDPMLPYAVALGEAQPWLDVTASAPPWFGSGGRSPLPAADLDAAYRGFMHALWWGIPGRSGDAAKAAAESGWELELELLELESPEGEPPAHRETAIGTEEPVRELESPELEPAAHRETGFEMEEIARELEARTGSPAVPAAAPSTEYPTQWWEGPVPEKKGGGCLRGCLTWAVGIVGIGTLVLLVLFSLDVVSPREKPCPLEAPPIPTPAQIAVAGDLFRDQCVRVRGTLVSRDADELLLDVDRDEYVQRVSVRDRSEVLGGIALGRVVTLAGWLRVEEDGTYAVDFIPDRGSDRDWWRNLRENLEGLFDGAAGG